MHTGNNETRRHPASSAAVFKIHRGAMGRLLSMTTFPCGRERLSGAVPAEAGFASTSGDSP